MINSGINFYSYRPSALIRVVGVDAQTFLQGQFTNDLQQEKKNLVYGLLLNQKGRVLADSQVLRLTDQEFLLVSGTSLAAVISKRLEQYIIADDVVLEEETAKFWGLALWGREGSEQMREVFGALPERGQFLRTNALLGFAGHRMKDENYEIIGSEQKIVALRTRMLGLKGREVAVGEMELARIAEGIPSVPDDIGPGDLPNEGGLEHTAISYTKGCYLGQEVMARLKNLGQVRRRLHVVRGRGVRLQPHAPVFQDGRKVGEIRSVADQGDEFVAFAMLSQLNLKLEAGLGCGPEQPANLRISPHE